MPKEVCKIKVFQSRMSLWCSLRISGEEGVGNQGGHKRVTVLHGVSCINKEKFVVQMSKLYRNYTVNIMIFFEKYLCIMKKFHRIPCCCKLKCRPCGGLCVLRDLALFAILGIVFVKTCSRSAALRSSSRKLARPSNRSGSWTSSSGSRLMLEK